jgi:hypothetical protein
MPCRTIRLPDGSVAIVRMAASRPRICTVCTRLTRDAVLCDFPVKSKTCDRVLCKECAKHVEPDLDYCPKHAPQVRKSGRLRL